MWMTIALIALMSFAGAPAVWEMKSDRIIKTSSFGGMMFVNLLTFFVARQLKRFCLVQMGLQSRCSGVWTSPSPQRSRSRLHSTACQPSASASGAGTSVNLQTLHLHHQLVALLLAALLLATLLLEQVHMARVAVRRRPGRSALRLRA